MSIKLTVGNDADENQILLEDCEIGDVVLLADGVYALVLRGANVEEDAAYDKKSLLLLNKGPNNTTFMVGCCSTKDAANGLGSGRIVKNIGKLNITID